MKRIFWIFTLTVLLLQITLVTTPASAASAPITNIYAPLISNPFTFAAGQNTACKTSGLYRLCASVSNALPARYTYVTVYGKLTRNGVAQTGKAMSTVWNYKTSIPTCNAGTTSTNGVAKCTRYISGATAGYKVTINVTISGVTATTFFTPH